MDKDSTISFENGSDNTYEELNFYGQGSTYFGILALNLVLTILSLGLYYPWAKAVYRKYLWNETEFRQSRLVFNGTGKEMFKGFLIAYIILLSFYIAVGLVSYLQSGFMIFILYYLFFLALIPFAIFGAWRYRVSRTSWRGIFFSFHGHLKDFMKIFFVGLFFTIITFGIYFAWFRVRIMKYLFSHTKIGDLKMDFHGDGGELFGINLIGAVLFYPSFLLYVPVWIKNRFNFTINNTSITDGFSRNTFTSTLDTRTAMKILLVNGILLIITLGLAYPWTYMRKLRMYFNNIDLPIGFDYDDLTQSNESFNDATGDEMSDILNIGIDF